MNNNIIQYLEHTASRLPNKTAFIGEDGSVTFSDLRSRSMDVAAVISGRVSPGESVLVLSGKAITTITYLLGILYAGCYYINLDSELPTERLSNIISRVDAKLMLVDDSGGNLAKSSGFHGEILNLSAPPARSSDPVGWHSTVDTDPMYVIFTSGSTGVPKGVVTPHRAVMDYIEAFSGAAQISEDDVFGNQAPLDYVAAIRDIYLPLYTGASTVLLQKKLFTMPGKLFRVIEEFGVTTLCWVVSAFCILAKLNAFSDMPKSIQKIIFTGSVMPPSVLAEYQKVLPQAMFMNHYGPTEITASCTYHILNTAAADLEEIPIGRPFSNTQILLLKSDGTVVPHNACGRENIGEICVKGTGLALGYYADAEKTASSFIQNPSNSKYPERIYKTGDLGWFDRNGILHFAGRMDRQIKHMGHRIELDEVEAAAAAIRDISSCSCQYDTQNEVLYLFYTGGAAKRDIALALRSKLPDFMVPRKILQLDEMPHLPNGKIDIPALKKLFK